MNGEKIFKIFFIAILLFLGHTIFYKPPERIYKLNILEKTQKCYFIDDFQSKFNNQNWNIIDQGNNYNKELQYYKPENVTVSNGYLTITSKLENYKDHNYTSGSINTKDKFEFLYGKIIIKAKPPKGDGLLSAIWLLPSDDSNFPEVDIIEVLGEQNDEVWSGIHYLNEFIINSSFKTTKVTDTDFFIYELVWKKDEIRGYINNKLVYQNKEVVPDKKMYLIVNLAVGGVWPTDVNNDIFPKDFLIDYIMVIPETCESR
ncbi:MAG: glycoside hydrolase family 16 protein [Bacilli bacterium]|nr:glycoside hydrolase family 16 protein [Bacilli bacterium]